MRKRMVVLGVLALLALAGISTLIGAVRAVDQGHPAIYQLADGDDYGNG